MHIYVKSDEGYLLGYSTTSKAFRVYNKRTKRVEENLHIDFLEDQPNVAGTGPNWMFDLDFLTNSMNYIPVSVENQVNVDAGTQDSYDVKDAQAQTSENASPSKDIQDSEDVFDKEDNIQAKKDEQSGEMNFDINVYLKNCANADKSSFVYLGGKIPIDASTLPNADLPIDPNMPDLEDASDTLPK
ncbi:hypothetical protein Tco_0718623 [Tanacetum coccineum]